MMPQVKRTILRAMVLLECSSIACEASAHWHNSITMYISDDACDYITKENSLGSPIVHQDVHGMYELTANVSKSKHKALNNEPTPAVFDCYTHADANPITLPELQGTFANIDPKAWYDYVKAGTSMYVDLGSGPGEWPCNNTYESIALVNSNGYNWCSKVSNTKTWGGKDGWNAWEIDDPDLFTLPSNWKEIYVEEREFAEVWDYWLDGIALELVHKTY